MKTIRLSLIALALALAAQAQTIRPMPTLFNQVVQTLPVAVPTSLTCVVGFAATCQFVLPAGSSDPYLCSEDVSGAGQTITIQDGQSTPVIWVSAVVGASGNTTTDRWQASGDSYCRWFPSGVYWQAGSTGATGHLTIKYSKQ